jgi:methylmalonyl-CoA/ethylmalonyl-CoA epimerase
MEDGVIDSTRATEARGGPLISVGKWEISFAVKDLDVMSAWYCDQLGFEVVQSRDFPEYGTRIVFLEADGVRIELIEDVRWQPYPRPNPPYHTGFQGVCQVAFFVDDMDAVVERVKQRPIEIAWDVITVDDLRMKELFIRDPEGNLIQFIERF